MQIIDQSVYAMYSFTTYIPTLYARVRSLVRLLDSIFKNMLKPWVNLLSEGEICIQWTHDFLQSTWESHQSF